MKAISATFEQHLAEALTTIATCWRVTRIDGNIYGFTDHDRDIYGGDITGIEDGILYRAAAGYTATDVESNNNLDIDNLDIDGLLVSPSITEDDLRAGLWDGATIKIFCVNWADLSQGAVNMRIGRLGQVTQYRDTFTATLLGLTFRYQKSIVEITSPSCRAVFGDERCKINLAGSPTMFATGTADSFNTLTLTMVDAGRSEAAGYWNAGRVVFSGGANAGLTFEIKQYTVGNVSFQTVPPYVIAAGDAYTIYRGCDKKFNTCRVTYNNVVNFRGEPHLQGNDVLAQVGRKR